MLYILLSALLLILLVSLIVMRYKKSHNLSTFLQSFALFAMLLLLTYALKVLMIYKPITILHVALLIMGWRSFYHFISAQDKPRYWMFFPWVTILAFVFVSLTFGAQG